jgi:hypothetical protein
MKTNIDKALDLALEALEGIHPGNMTPMAEEYWNKAITAITKVLATPVQEPESFEQWNAKQHGDPEEIGFLQALRIAYCSGQDSVTKATPPAAQRQWVGLTDEEILEAAGIDGADTWIFETAYAIETKLKEKNT